MEKLKDQTNLSPANKMSLIGQMWSQMSDKQKHKYKEDSSKQNCAKINQTSEKTLDRI